MKYGNHLNLIERKIIRQKYTAWGINMYMSGIMVNHFPLIYIYVLVVPVGHQSTFSKDYATNFS